LVQRLLEYKRYKEAAINLKELEDEQKYIYYRRLFIEDQRNAEDAQCNNYTNANLFDLIRAINKVLSKKNQEVDKEHIVNLFTMTVEEKSNELLQALKKSQRLKFSQFISKMNKPSIIVTFLAILDLLRNKVINIIQDNSFDEIIISISKDSEIVAA